MTAIRDAIDAGGAAGKLEICCPAYAAILATITFFGGDVRVGEADVGAACCYDGTEKY